jgi:ATP-binding cassette subfamily F protein 3
MIRIKDLSISFAGHSVFEDVNIVLNKGEKIGLIGRNGSGKSTFLNLILGKVEPDHGAVEKPRGYTVGHLEQHIKFTHPTVSEEVASVLPVERDYESWKGDEILMGLGFSYEDTQKEPSLFSGGYQVKINLAKLLLMEPNMLFLDEPTNYLDIHSIKWLKGFLKNWSGEMVLITHDRAFMDEIISHSLFIHRGQFRKYPGNTSAVYDVVAQEEEMQEKTRVNADKKRQKTEEWINRFKSKASMASRAQSKMKMLDKEERIDKLSDVASLDFSFNYLPYTSKENIAKMKDVKFGYSEDEVLFDNFSLDIKHGDKICIIGKNGKGKSTLLKAITGDIPLLGGEVSFHQSTVLGFFGQMNIDRLDPKKSVNDELQAVNPGLELSTIRKTCANMMFKGTLVHKPISVLSGGEKSRVMLGKILLKSVNMLLLDEPTNHLDMESCEALLDAIKAFEGTVMLVTHDEYFLREIANKLVVFDNDEVSIFEGTYDEFLAKKGWSE